MADEAEEERERAARIGGEGRVTVRADRVARDD